MNKLILLQAAVLAVLSAAAWLVCSDAHIAASLLLGGLSYVVPTAVAVLFLNLLKPYPAFAGAGFIFSEGLKIVLSLVCLVSVFLLYADLRFIPYFIGLLAVSHLVFLLFLKVHRYGK